MTDNESSKPLPPPPHPHPGLDELIATVRKIIKEAGHNELRYPELTTITTYSELSAWINKYCKCFYSVFRQDLLAVLGSISSV